MKRKVLAVLTVAGVLGVTSAALADININVDLDSVEFRPVAKTRTQEPPEPRNLPNGQRPPEPPEFRSGDKRPPMSGDRRPNKRPPKPRSDDRRPPEFENN